MSQSNNSPMDLINQYFKKLVNRLHNLELENSNLKTSISNIKNEFTSLNDRHTELKKAYTESERQINDLILEKETILRKETELSNEIKNTFDQSLDFGKPFLDFSAQSLDFGTPSLDFGIPSLDFSEQSKHNLDSAINSLDFIEQIIKKADTPLFEFPNIDNKNLTSSFQTPKRKVYNRVEESQKRKHGQAKLRNNFGPSSKKLVLRNLYESDSNDSDTDNSNSNSDYEEYINRHIPQHQFRKLSTNKNINSNKSINQQYQVPPNQMRFNDWMDNLQSNINSDKDNIPTNQSTNQSTNQTTNQTTNQSTNQHLNQKEHNDNTEDSGIDILKKLIGNDLWNHIEASINHDQSPTHQQMQQQQAKPMQQQPMPMKQQQQQQPTQTHVPLNFLNPTTFENIFSNNKSYDEDQAFVTNLMEAILHSSTRGGKK